MKIVNCCTTVDVERFSQREHPLDTWWDVLTGHMNSFGLVYLESMHRLIITNEGRK